MTYVRRKLRHDPWWHVAGLSLGILFALMLMGARLYPEYLRGIDIAVESLILPYQSFTSIAFFLVITTLGGSLGVSLIALGAAYLLRRNWFTVLRLLILLVSSGFTMGLAKAFVERARPEVLMWLDPLNTYSFPSGHATLATALYGFLAVCLHRRIQNPVLRTLAVAVCILIILLVSASRLVLNAHYFTDVIAGMLLGLFWLCIVFMLPRPR